MSDEERCTFCRIVARREPASIVYEDDAVVGFLDVLPINPGHTLIVPRRHGAFLKDLRPEDGARLFLAGQRIAAALRANSLRCEAVNLLLNDGAEAGQRVYHTHLHVIPRIAGDSLRRDLEAEQPTREQLDAVAAEIRRHIEVAE
ncbi:MAG TPA: HIT domain-containing protein [Dehalococcoidia bacterium]|nr:HIT domain-containing protein [Dehalococcoidia bacterium]